MDEIDGWVELGWGSMLLILRSMLGSNVVVRSLI